MPHLVLLGDATFDSHHTADGSPSVFDQVLQRRPPGWSATLCASEGAVAQDVPAQLGTLPAGASHLALSVGGNNAMQFSDVLDAATYSSGDALLLLADAADRFEQLYRQAVDACRARGLPLLVCTIHQGHFPDARYQRMVKVGLAGLNDVILRVAIEHGLCVIDLRFLLCEPADFATPIEVSSAGGAKIAAALWRALEQGRFGGPGANVLGAETARSTLGG